MLKKTKIITKAAIHAKLAVFALLTSSLSSSKPSSTADPFWLTAEVRSMCFLFFFNSHKSSLTRETDTKQDSKESKIARKTTFKTQDIFKTQNTSKTQNSLINLDQV